MINQLQPDKQAAMLEQMVAAAQQPQGTMSLQSPPPNAAGAFPPAMDTAAMQGGFDTAVPSDPGMMQAQDPNQILQMHAGVVLNQILTIVTRVLQQQDLNSMTKYLAPFSDMIKTLQPIAMPEEQAGEIPPQQQFALEVQKMQFEQKLELQKLELEMKLKEQEANQKMQINAVQASLKAAQQHQQITASQDAHQQDSQHKEENHQIQKSSLQQQARQGEEKHAQDLSINQQAADTAEQQAKAAPTE